MPALVLPNLTLHVQPGPAAPTPRRVLAACLLQFCLADPFAPLRAVLTVLQIITGEDWELVMFDTYGANGLWGVAFCVSVAVAGHYVVLQMFVAVLTFTLQQLTVKKAQRLMIERQTARETTRDIVARTGEYLKRRKLPKPLKKLVKLGRRLGVGFFEQERADRKYHAEARSIRQQAVENHRKSGAFRNGGDSTSNLLEHSAEHEESAELWTMPHEADMPHEAESAALLARSTSGASVNVHEVRSSRHMSLSQPETTVAHGQQTSLRNSSGDQLVRISSCAISDDSTATRERLFATPVRKPPVGLVHGDSSKERLKKAIRTAGRRGSSPMKMLDVAMEVSRANKAARLREMQEEMVRLEWVGQSRLKRESGSSASLREFFPEEEKRGKKEKKHEKKSKKSDPRDVNKDLDAEAAAPVDEPAPKPFSPKAAPRASARAPDPSSRTSARVPDLTRARSICANERLSISLGCAAEVPSLSEASGPRKVRLSQRANEEKVTPSELVEALKQPLVSAEIELM